MISLKIGKYTARKYTSYTDALSRLRRNSSALKQRTLTATTAKAASTTKSAETSAEASHGLSRPGKSDK